MTRTAIHNDETAVFEFVNIYNKPTIIPDVPDKPDTGDRNMLLLWVVCAIAAFTVLVTIAKHRSISEEVL